MLPFLQVSFGFSSFRPGQEEALASLMAGRDTLVVMPTGAGKSLIYQLAALHLPGLTLVISPLIALMKDQVDGLVRKGIPAAYLNSALPSADQNDRLRRLAQGEYRLLYVAPERLRNMAFQKALRNRPLSLLAVDEAHCISEWGHDFRPDYLHIARVKAELNVPLTVALTATATPKVQEDILRQLCMGTAACRIVTGFNRPNLSLNVRYTHGYPAKLRLLREQISAGKHDGAILVYTGTRHEAEEVAEFACEALKIPAAFYHAGLPPEERARIQEAFIYGRMNFIAATNAFGMGIDRADVRQVIHFSMPGSLEAYYQEAGRAGRDGQPATATLFYDPQDRALQEFFIENSVASLEDLRLLHGFFQNGRQTSTTIDELSRLTGLHPVRIRVGLADLERAGALQHLGDDGLRMLFRTGAWNSAEIENAVAAGQTHLQRRRAQLESMIAYAESNLCRRKLILQYFGDSGPAEAPDCCDNCHGRQAAPQSGQALEQMTHGERLALILLDTVRRLDPKVGKSKLAKIVHGSKAQDIHNSHYDHNIYYGRLAALKRGDIEGFVDELTESGYLKVIGGEYPVLSLTSKGEQAIQNKENISLKLPRSLNGFKVIHSQGKPEAAMHSLDTFPTQNFHPDISRIVLSGNTKSTEAIPELIAALKYHDGNIRRLAASALGKIGAKEAVLHLMELLATEKKPQVRQYTVKALGRIGDSRAEELLRKISIDERELEYTRKAARSSLLRCGSHGTSSENSSIFQGVTPQEETDTLIRSFLRKNHPRPLKGPWAAGWSLGFHSRFTGADWSRSEVGAWVHRLKYENDFSVIPSLVELALSLIGQHPELARVDAIVMVPPSLERETDPVQTLSEALADKIHLPCEKMIVKRHPTRPQKEMKTLAQKRANVAGAFALTENPRGRRLLLIDDLYDSGATLEEITRLLLRREAQQVNVLTLTRTIHTDG